MCRYTLAGVQNGAGMSRHCACGTFTDRHNIDARIQPAVAPIPTDIPGLLTCIYKTITHIVSRYNRHKSVNSDSSNKNCSLGGSDFTHTQNTYYTIAYLSQRSL